MIVGLYLRRIDVAFNGLGINNNDGASESPGMRRAAHFLFVRPLVGSKAGGAIGRFEATRDGSVINRLEDCDMICGLYRHRIDFAIGRLRMNSNDGVPEKPGIRRAAHDLFMRPLVVQLMAVEVSKLFV
jgi:hypothetical protein